MNDVLRLLLCIPASFLLVVVIWASVAIPNSWFWKLLWEKDPIEIPGELVRTICKRDVFNNARTVIFFDDRKNIVEAELIMADSEGTFLAQKITIKDVSNYIGVKGKPMWKITIVYPGNYKVISIYKTRLEALYKSFVRISAYINMYRMMIEYPDGQLVPVYGKEGK